MKKGREREREREGRKKEPIAYAKPRQFVACFRHHNVRGRERELLECTNAKSIPR